MKLNKITSVIPMSQEEKGICMNTPYISVQKMFEIVNKTIAEYDKLRTDGKSVHEQKVGLVGRIVATKIKNNLMKEINNQQQSFD